MRQNMGFASGMLVGIALSESAIVNGSKPKTLDWLNAVEVMRERNASNVSAGLAEDWACTSNSVLCDGVPNTSRDCAWVSSMWATPIIVVDGEEVECWKEGDDNEWWPSEAISAWNNVDSN